MGLNAVRALVARRIDDVIRVYIAEDLVREFSQLLKWCAERRRAYHVVGRDELDRIAGSVHHEGIVLLVKEKAPLPLDVLCRELSASDRPEIVVLLEDVSNPHNVGAILRIAAHFGARAIIVPSEGSGRLSGALVRTAEGGAEAVDLVRADDLGEAIEELAKLGFRSIGTSSHARRSVFSAPLPARTVFVLGSEGEGLSRSALDACDEVVAIPGTGAVESLNVATATAVLLAEHWRVHSEREPASPRAPRSSSPRGTSSHGSSSRGASPRRPSSRSSRAKPRR